MDWLKKKGRHLEKTLEEKVEKEEEWDFVEIEDVKVRRGAEK